MIRPILRHVLIVALFLSIVKVSVAQGVFHLHSKSEKADINYVTIKNINSLDHGYDAMLGHFKPVSGEFTVYIFLKEFKGTSIEYMESNNPDTLVPFHDMIILKTNAQDVIVDGYYYRLEWAEVPSQFMLFRSYCNAVKLTDELSVRSLNFLNEYELYNQTEGYSGMYETNEFGQRILQFLVDDIIKL